jgi:hypothetical protein
VQRGTAADDRQDRRFDRFDDFVGGQAGRT